MKSLYLLAASATVLGLVSSADAQSRSVSMSGITVDYTGEVAGSGDFSGATVDVNGRFGEDLELSGAAVEANVDVGGDLDASGGSVELSGSVAGRAEISGGAVDINMEFSGPLNLSGGAIDISSNSVFEDDVEISVGALDFDGHAMAGLEIEFGNMEFAGQADQAVDFEGDNREGIFRRRDRSEIDISGTLQAGGRICAHEVRFETGAQVNGPLTVYADEEPYYVDGFDASNVNFIQRDNDRCRNQN